MSTSEYKELQAMVQEDWRTHRKEIIHALLKHGANPQRRDNQNRLEYLNAAGALDYAYLEVLAEQGV